MLPPPLTWIDSLSDSLSRALDEKIVVECRPTVNPLVSQVKIKWKSGLAPTRVNNIWNYFQQWAALNDCVPNGSVQREDTFFSVGIIMKRRLGAPRDTLPWDK